MNFIKTHIILFLVVLSFKLSAQPWWFKNPPTSSSGNYYYYSIEADSIQEAKVKAFIAASAIYGELETSNNTIEETVIIQDGVAKDYTKIKGLVTLGGEKIRYKIIEQKNRKGKLYLLFMFGPKTDKLLPKGRHFSVPLATGLSLAVPGLGQIYKKEGIKGVLLITSFVSGMGVGIWSEIQKGQAVKNFNSATTFNQREQFKSDAYKFRNIRNIGCLLYTSDAADD